MECRSSIIDCRMSWIARLPRIAGLLILSLFSASPDARGNIIITLQAMDAAGNAIADPVPAGTKVSVDVSLSVDQADEPLQDLRSIKFDFRATTTTVVLSNFLWELPPGVDATSYSQTADLPQPQLAYLSKSRVGSSIIDLNTTPLRIATLDAIVNSSGAIDARNPGADASGGVSFMAGFSRTVDYDLAAGNVSGGTLLLLIEGATAPDNRNTGPRATGGCGGSVAGAMLLSLGGLCCLSYGRGRITTRAAIGYTVRVRAALGPHRPSGK